MKYVIAVVILFVTVKLQAQDMPGMKMPMPKKESGSENGQAWQLPEVRNEAGEKDNKDCYA